MAIFYLEYNLPGQTPIPALVAPIAVAVLFVAHHFGANAQRWLDPAAHASDSRLVERAVHLQRLWGAVLLGVVPLGIVALCFEKPILHYGFQGDLERGLISTFGLLAVSLPAVFLNSKKAAFRQNYPEMKLSVPWSTGVRVRNGLTWCLFLLAYEFCFRGFLLFCLADAFGPWAAISLTTMAYVLAHLPKNVDETIGTIPMGVLFALTALWSGGFWPAFVAHCVIANTADWLASRSSALQPPTHR